jgi:hypothetical protein
MSLATLPSAIGAWSIARITAGLWLSESAGPVPAAVLGLPAEAGRPNVAVDADAPSPGTDRLLAELFPVLCSAGLTTVRLVLSSAADRYAPAAQAHGLDLIAAEAEVTITPHGYAVVRPAGSLAPGAAPQWRRCLPGGESLPAGMLSPSPAWERGLDDELNGGLEPHLAVHRVPAGIAVHPPGPATGFVRAARAVWPDPERLIIVVDGAGDQEALLDSLTALLRQLPRAAAAGVRLWWPRAPARAGIPGLQEMARRCGTSLLAPTADVSVNEGFGGVCHGPMGAAPWLRFSPAGATQLMGSLYPEPGWERALAGMALAAPPGLVVEQVAAGLSLYRQDHAASSLAATARSLIPDPARATIIVDGDAMSAEVRRDLDTIIGRLPAAARRSLRIALTAAARGGQESYAQSLADTFESAIVAPSGTWTATPDGRLLARSASGAARGSRSEASGWREFSPRYLLGTGPPGSVGVPDRAAGPLRQVGPSPLRRPGRGPAGPAPGQPGASRPGPVPGQPPASRPGPVPPSVSRPAPSQPGPGPGRPDVSRPGRSQPAGSRPQGQPRLPPSGSRSRPGAPDLSRPRAFPPTPRKPQGGDAAPGGDQGTQPGGAGGTAPDGEREVRGEREAAPGGRAGDHPAPEPGSARPEGGPHRLVLLSRDHRSSAEERRLYRESAHTYQTHAVTARRMLTQRPGLRAVADGEPVDAVITDFAAVLDYLGDDPRAVADKLRSAGTAGDPRVACILSGLRRLPSFAGAVFSSARAPGHAAETYIRRRILIEPSFVSATSSVLVALEGDISYVIWSQTGKRVAALAADAARDEILFAAGTTYKILGVNEGKSGSQQMRVFLRELPAVRGAGSRRAGAADLRLAAAQPDEQPDDMDNKVLKRLSTAVSLRDDAFADENARIRRAGSSMPPIGLDSNGVPFAEPLGA